MDTIDATNLNRQFLFRAHDVGKSKAEAAANFVNNRVAGVQVHPFLGKMQDKPEEFYQKFHVVICGLDSVPARRWINSTLVNLLAETGALGVRGAAERCQLNSLADDGQVDLDTVVPMIDAGTEGFKVRPFERSSWLPPTHSSMVAGPHPRHFPGRHVVPGVHD